MSKLAKAIEVIILVALGFFMGLSISGGWGNAVDSRAYKRMRSDIRHPDTFIGYWDRGALLLMFNARPKASDTVDEFVAEDDR